MSRKEILDNIAKNKPKENFPIPEIDLYLSKENNDKVFTDILPKISVKKVSVKTYAEIVDVIDENFSDDIRLINTIDSIKIKGEKIDILEDVKALDGLDLAIIKGDLAIAENGAIWVSDKNLPHRIIPFICENLVLVIDKKNIVYNMHQVYKLQDNIDYNYGVFIAGPSKTADIEQSLVVGAQGPRNMMVIVVG